MPLQPQVLIMHFEKWELEFVVPINPPLEGRSIFFVCIYYVTKWVEAKEVPRAMEKVVVDFLFVDIFVQFGVPREIVTNQGTKFTSKLV